LANNEPIVGTTDAAISAQGMLELIKGKQFNRWVLLPEQAMQRKSNEQNTLPQPFELNAQQSSSFTLYPNPADNSVMLEYLFKEVGNIDVLDMLGKSVYKQNTEKNSSINVLNVSNLTNGVYVVRITDGDNIQQHKLLIQK
jgi:hypothetical protein